MHPNTSSRLTQILYGVNRGLSWFTKILEKVFQGTKHPASLLLMVLFIFQISPTIPERVPATATPESLPGAPIYLVADPSSSSYRVPAPAWLDTSTPSTINATINVDYMQSGSMYGYSCNPWSSQAVNAFSAATAIWASLMDSPVPIVIRACWASMGSSILGGSGVDAYYPNFSGAPVANTFYPVSLANALSGSDLNGSSPDMHIIYNSDFNWYFGTDGNTPGNQYDFKTVVLHEIAHGLGFAGSMTVESGLGYWGWGDYTTPAIYDRFTQNGSAQALLSFAYGSVALAMELQSNNLFFNGPNTNAANGNTPAKLYAPITWAGGSSYSHLDEIYNNTPNALMTYSLPPGESLHDPGPVAMGIFKDIGWNTSTSNTNPTISNLPDQYVPINSKTSQAIDLWAYTSDPESADDQLTYTIDNAPNPSAGITISSNRYISINPSFGWSGETEVVVRARDPGGLSDTDTFKVTIARFWQGTTGTNWHNPANWFPSSVPSGSDIVIIQEATHHAIISDSNAAIGGLYIWPGGVLDLANRTLTVEAFVINQGTLKQYKEIGSGSTSEFLRIKNQVGNTRYYGIDITPIASPTSVVGVSIHGDQQCSFQVPGVQRCYEISVSQSIQATVRFYFTEAERGSLNLQSLLVFHLEGNWLQEPGPYSRGGSGIGQYVEAQNIDNFSRFALSNGIYGSAVFLPIISRNQ